MFDIVLIIVNNIVGPFSNLEKVKSRSLCVTTINAKKTLETLEQVLFVLNILPQRVLKRLQSILQLQ